MKRFIFVLTLLLFIFMYDYVIFKDTTYDLYDNLIKKTNYKIINNLEYLKEENKQSNTYIYNEYKDDTVHNKNDLVNKIYTIVNNGYDKYTIYCDYNCTDDITNLSNNTKIKYINDFVSTYNKYKNIKTLTYDNKKVDIKINRLYSKEDKDNIDNLINNVIDEYNINNFDDIRTKIRLFHDYLINNSSYDEEYTENSNNNSNKATGPLFDHKGVCSGYTDALSIFLDKINVENVKLSNDNHVWNIVNIDNTWLNIDSTFDDPVTYNHQDYLLYDYFLIGFDELNGKPDTEHSIDTNIYNFIN